MERYSLPPGASSVPSWLSMGWRRPPADAQPQALPAFGLCAEVEPPGAHLGLSLPRLPFYGEGEAD